MGGNGPLPGTGAKPQGQKRRRNKDETNTELDGGARVPTPKLGDGYRDETYAWWESWCDSAQATLFTKPTWTRLRMVAALVNDFHDPETAVSVRKQLLAEIRLNESLLLATPGDQLRAKLDLRPPTNTGKAPATAKTDAKRSAARKARLLSVVKNSAQAG